MGAIPGPMLSPSIAHAYARDVDEFESAAAVVARANDP